MHKNNKEAGPASVGIELDDPNDYGKLVANMKEHNFRYTELNKESDLFGYLV